MKHSISGCVAILLVISGCVANPAERNNSGGALFNQGDYTNALNAFQAAQVLSPDAAEPYFNAASALSQLGKLEDAQAALEQALKTSDEALTPQAYYNLGNVYFELGLYGDAVTAYQHTLLLNPDDNDARYNLELALKQIAPLTTTPIDQQTPGVTPSSIPDDQQPYLATPSPEPATLTPQSATSESTVETPPPAESAMSVEQSEQLLDSIQQDQGRLPDKQETQLPGNVEPEKDW
jgi:Ca-activated chloride channel family protein